VQRFLDMRLLMIGVGAVIAIGCATSRPREAQTAEGFDCVPGPPAKAARVFRAKSRDSVLALHGDRALVVTVDSLQSTHGIREAGVFLDATREYGYTDSLGQTTLSKLPEGDVAVTVRRIGYGRWHGIVSIRTAYRDTLRLGLRPSVACATPVRF
jgi:hypothetical protein